MARNEGRSLEFWSSSWEYGFTGWHLDEANENLVKNAHLLLSSSESQKVFVPLCGKSLDLIWLYNKGHTVIGVEGVEQAVHDFFVEQGIGFEVESIPEGKIYKSTDSRLTVYACNIFDLPTDKIGRVDAVWDRGSLVAIDDCNQERYAALMKKILAPTFRYLLTVLDYQPNEKFSGPPSSIPIAAVNQLFGDVADTQLLNSVDQSNAPWFVNYGIPKALERIILMCAKK